MAEPRFRILARERVHDGFYRLDVLTLTHERFLGGWTEPLRRELLVQRPAVAVLPYDPARDLVVLVEQFRTGCVDRPGEPWLVEAVAGPGRAGRAGDGRGRARGRGGDRASRSAGLSSSAATMRAPAAPPSRSTCSSPRSMPVPLAGSSGWRTRTRTSAPIVLPALEAFAMVADGRIIAANSVIPLLWLQLHRERLRAEWRRAAA